MTSPIRNRVDQVFIPVNDMPRAIAWYSRLFGLPPGEAAHEGDIYDVPISGETRLLLDPHKPVASHSMQPICMFPYGPHGRAAGDRERGLRDLWLPRWQPADDL